MVPTGHELAEQRRQDVARVLRIIDQRGILHHVHRAGAGHPLFGQADRDLQMADVANSDLAMSSYVDSTMLADSEITFRTIAVAYGAEALAELVMTDHYIGFLPEHCMATRVEEGDVRAVMPERFVLERPFKIILKKGRSAEILIESFVDVLGQASTQA